MPSARGPPHPAFGNDRVCGTGLLAGSRAPCPQHRAVAAVPGQECRGGNAGTGREGRGELGERLRLPHRFGQQLEQLGSGRRWCGGKEAALRAAGTGCCQVQPSPNNRSSHISASAVILGLKAPWVRNLPLQGRKKKSTTNGCSLKTLYFPPPSPSWFKRLLIITAAKAAFPAKAVGS